MHFWSIKIHTSSKKYLKVLDYQNERGKKIKKSWFWKSKLVNCAIPSTVFNRCPFLEDFIEILLSNGPYMIIKNAKTGEFGISWIPNFEKYIFFSDIIEEKEAFQGYLIIWEWDWYQYWRIQNLWIFLIYEQLKLKDRFFANIT